VLLGVWAAGGSALAGETLDEVDLVRQVLSGSVHQARQGAVEAGLGAAATASPLLSNPVLEARREQGAGTDDVLGVSLGIEPGGLAARRTAALHGAAAEARIRAETVSQICAVRADALELWSAQERALVAQEGQVRLEGVLDGLGALADVGEVAGYEEARVALTVAAHGHARDAWMGAALDARAAMSARAGVSVDGVVLAPLDTGSTAPTLARALEGDPELVVLRRERDAAVQAIVAARRAGLPELGVSAGTRWESEASGAAPTPGFEVGAGVELPLFDRNQVAVAEARAALARLDAEVAAREAELRGVVAASGERLARLGPVPVTPDVGLVWDGARARYEGGEASVEELLAVAADIEAAELAALDGVVLRRRVRLELACLVGAFSEPVLQGLLEEHSR